MHIGNAFDRFNKKFITGSEGRSHSEGKNNLCKILNEGEITIIFNDTNNEIRLVRKDDEDSKLNDRVLKPYRCALEVGWPGLMENCTGPSYCEKFKTYPDFIFDIGVFSSERLVGAIEIAATHRCGIKKLEGILRSGLWLIELSSYVLGRAEWSPDRKTMTHICDKAWIL